MRTINKISPVSLLSILLLILVIINILQSYFTPLNSDEAYYWMYSKYPSWGYFDHPPMIAMMIKAGYALIASKLGLRLMVIAANLISLVLIWNLLDSNFRKSKANVLFFFLLVCSLPVINMYGFIATPDSPLVFFEVLILFLYKRFSEKNNWKYTLLLGISMAAIMYSKYHGALLIILIILSDLKLLRNPKFYFAGIFALILFIPHVYWQVSNDFPSLRYHLVDRVSGFKISEVPEYLMNTLIIQNPLVLPAAVILLIRRKTFDRFERTLVFIFTGIFIFFLFSSFRYHVEPHWTALMTPPLIILTINSLKDFPKTDRYLKPVIIISTLLFLVFRSAFMFDYLPLSILKKQYHDTRRRFVEIAKIAGDRPVVFTNSYQNPSRYTFYTNKFAHTLNNLNYRKNQYDLWDFEERLHGKDVLYVPHYFEPGYREKYDKYRTSYGDTIYIKNFTDFQSLQRECCILNDDSYTFSRSGSCNIDLEIFNPYPYPVNLDHGTFPVHFMAGFFENGKLKYSESMDLDPDPGIISPGDTVRVKASFSAGSVPAGKYKLSVCSETGILYKVFNSKFREATVTE